MKNFLGVPLVIILGLFFGLIICEYLYADKFIFDHLSLRLKVHCITSLAVERENLKTTIDHYKTYASDTLTDISKARVVLLKKESDEAELKLIEVQKKLIKNTLDSNELEELSENEIQLIFIHS